MRIQNTLRFLAGRLALIGIALLFSYVTRGAEPAPGALTAWRSHVEQAKAELEASADCQPGPFLLVDRYQKEAGQAHSGKILALHAAGEGVLPVPSGLIHHWTGIVYVPNVRAAAVLRALKDYDSYAAIYQPAVTKSRLLNHAGSEFRYRLEFQAKGFGIKSGLRGDFRSTYVSLDARQGYSVTEATRLVELEHPGTAEEREFSPAEAHGYIQRMFTIVRYREMGDGVVVEVETLTLSRDIPASVRWLVEPFVERFSKQVLTGTLEKFRDRVESLSQTNQLHMAGLP